MRGSQRHRWVVLGLAPMLLMLGCGGSGSEAEPSASTSSASPTPDAAPSMEDAIADLEKVQNELVATLERDHGITDWTPDAVAPGLRTAPCESPAGAEQAYLPVKTAPVATFSVEDWEQSAASLAKSASTHGFAEAGAGLVTAPGERLRMDRPDGAEFVYGSGAAGIGTGEALSIQLRTGCLQWAEPNAGG